MLDLKNVVLSNLDTSKKANAKFVELKGLMDTKCNTYLQWTATKNQVNRASTYHYLMLAVQESTAPVNGIDYIHPSVKPAVDYATAVITKGLKDRYDSGDEVSKKYCELKFNNIENSSGTMKTVIGAKPR